MLELVNFSPRDSDSDSRHKSLDSDSDSDSDSKPAGLGLGLESYASGLGFGLGLGLGLETCGLGLDSDSRKRGLVASLIATNRSLLEFWTWRKVPICPTPVTASQVSSRIKRCRKVENLIGQVVEGILKHTGGIGNKAINHSKKLKISMHSRN